MRWRQSSLQVRAACDSFAAGADLYNPRRRLPMTMAWLDHVNIRTSNLEAVSRFYSEILGLRKGPRSPFGFPGAWHYCGDKAVVHLIEVDKAPLGKDPKIEHFAFRSTGLGDFVAHLRKKKVEH